MHSRHARNFRQNENLGLTQFNKESTTYVNHGSGKSFVFNIVFFKCVSPKLMA